MTSPTQTSLAQTTQIIQQGIDAGLHPGAQVCVYRDGECVADLALGSTGIADDARPLTPEDLTLWLSAGKPILVVALAQQVEAGVLCWDDPIAEWVPEFAQRGKDPVTLRHALTHTGGFRSVVFRYPQQTWEEAVAAVCHGRLEGGWEVGQTAGYHPHSSWNILGRVLEIATDQPLSQHLRRAVVEPMGLRDTWVGMPAEVLGEVADRLSGMTDTGKTPPRPTDMHTPAWITGQRPGGNTYGPAAELARFYQSLLPLHPHAAADLPAPQQSPILQPETVADLTRRHRRDTVDRTFRATMDWGLGFMVNNRRHDAANAAQHGEIGTPYNFGPHAGEHAFGHGGNQSSIGFADPEHGLAVAVVFNGMPGEPAHQRRMHRVLTALYRDLRLVP